MKSKDVILFSSADWDTPYWTNKQHTAMHLAKLGYRVLYVETVGIRAPKLSGQDLTRIAKRLLRSLSKPKKVSENIWILSPLSLPFFRKFKLVTQLNEFILCMQITISISILRFSSVLVWTYHPYMLGVLKRRFIQSIVYHCVDDISAIPGVDVKAFKCAEKRLIGNAGAVFVTSQKLEENCRRYSNNVYFLPNVVDYEHFASARHVNEIPEDLSIIPEPRIGYIGVLSDFKVDFELVREVAVARPDLNWVFIGEERVGQENALVRDLKEFKNVHFLGYKSYDDLPKYLAGFNVATFPTLINDYTESMFPMKYYEYVAAGLPIVSTPLSFTYSLSSEIAIANNAEEFCLKLNQQINEGLLGIEQSIKIVGPNTWQTRLKNMLEVVG